MQKILSVFLCLCGTFFLAVIDVQADYIDPSVMTYAIQAIAGLVIGLGAFFSVYGRRFSRLLRTDETKETESDALIFEDPAGGVRKTENICERKEDRKAGGKELLVSVLLSVFMSFILVVYKPLEVFFTNMEEFSFSFDSIIPYLLLLFVILAAAEFLVHLLCFKIPKRLYYLSLVAAMTCFLAFYIQGNILVRDLPEADGGMIDWSQYAAQNRQSLILWIAAAAFCGILARVFNRKGFSLFVTSIAGTVCAVSLGMLVFLGIRNHGFEGSVKLRATAEKLNEYSADVNLILVIPDMTDSRTFKSVLEENKDEFAEIFRDFTYYPDTLSCFPRTGYSLPQILTGEIYKRQEDYDTFYNRAVDHSPLLNTLKDRGFEKTIHHHQGEVRYGSHPEEFVNVRKRKYEFEEPGNFTMDVLRMVFFYHMPYPLKKYEPYAIYNLTHEKEKDAYDWSILYLNDYLLANSFETVPQKMFHLIHFEGAHDPYRFDKDLNYVGKRQPIREIWRRR